MKDTTAEYTAERERYDDLADELAATQLGVQIAKMMGMPCLKVDGKTFAGFLRGAMVFKLTGEPHTQALGLAGAKLFDPSGRGHPMKEWVCVPAAHAETWPAFAASAIAYVRPR
jgi:hypothetical protein